MIHCRYKSARAWAHVYVPEQVTADDAKRITAWLALLVSKE
jgi:hypothetical protein